MEATVSNITICNTDDGDMVFVAAWIPLDKLKLSLGLYDPSSGTSPSVSESRPVLRAILDEALRIGITPL